MGYDASIPQHKNIAYGDDTMESQNFGCKPMDHSKGPSMGAPDAKIMKDGERGAGKPVKHSEGKMPSQASADHGSHKYAK